MLLKPINNSWRDQTYACSFLPELILHQNKHGQWRIFQKRLFSKRAKVSCGKLWPTLYNWTCFCSKCLI